MSAVILRQSEPRLLAGWAPMQPGDALGMAWQVQTSIAAIAFAGLALVIQLAGDPPVAIRSSREVLFDQTHFRLLLFYAGGSNVTLGLVSTWLQSDGGVLLCFIFCFVGTLALIGFSYVQAARFFLDDHRATDQALEVLLDKLKDGIREQQSAAEANQLLAERFPSSGLVRRLRGKPAGPVVIPLVSSAGGKRVTGFDPVALRGVAASLLRSVRDRRFEATQDASTKPSDALSKPATLVISYGLSDVVPRGGALFHLVLAEAPAPKLLRTYDQRLRRCVRLAAAEGQVEDELVTLKDSLLVAAQAGTTGALERGLDVYERLFTQIIQTRRDGPDGSTRAAYGSYWRAMQRNLREIGVVAVDKLGSTGVTLVADNAYALCAAAFDAREIDALREFLALYQSYFYQVTDPARPLAPEYLLVSLQNLLDLRISPAVTSDPVVQPVAELSSAAAIADTMKVCVDRGDAALLQRVLDYFRYPTRSRRLTEEGRAARTAAALAALGWAFFRWRTDDQPDQMRDVCRILLDVFQGADLWAGYIKAADSAEGWPWERWEIERARPMRARLMEFHTFLAGAAVAAASRVGMRTPTDNPSPSDADRAGTLLAAFELSDQLLTELQIPVGGGNDRLEGNLKALIDRRAQIDRAVLQNSPLEASRVEQFVQGLSEALHQSGERLSDILAAGTGDEDAVEGTDLYYNHLQPRDFFVTSERVYADPSELGRSIGAGLIDGENAYLVKTLTDGHERKSADADNIKRLWSDRSSYIVVINDWDLADQIGIQSWTPGVQNQRGLFITVDGADEICLILDLEQVARVQRSPKRLDQMGPSPRELPCVAVAVRDYDEPTQQPAAHVMVGTSLTWTRNPGDGVQVLIRKEDS
ncbi:hypothetical protein [Phytohabitans suffuscus]|uniref:hypothetical protein n=1 Tax=Phytohabitans suffuscus TaxID=624315 RepID=UPI0015644F17|nr:hypothetical protein [Phytohabitans suffuscus]